MIYSTLRGTDDRSGYPPAIQKALDYLEKTDLLSMETGTYEIDGKKMFANVMDMTTHPFAGSHPEVHKKYADLMYWPEGGEKIGVAPYRGDEEVFEDRPENDITLLADVRDENILTTSPGQFCVFFPWDAHRPAIMLGDAPATSRKCVIKIGMELLK